MQMKILLLFKKKEAFEERKQRFFLEKKNIRRKNNLRRKKSLSTKLLQHMMVIKIFWDLYRAPKPRRVCMVVRRLGTNHPCDAFPL